MNLLFNHILQLGIEDSRIFPVLPVSLPSGFSNFELLQTFA